MSYKLLQVSQLSGLGVIGGNYLDYPLYKDDIIMATIGTETGNLSTSKVTVEELTQSFYQVGNTTSPWVSAGIGATRRVYAPNHKVAIGSSNWSEEFPYEAQLTVLGGLSSNQGLSAAPTLEGFRTVLMGNVGINTNSFGTSETYKLNVDGNANVTSNLSVDGNLTVGGNIDGGDAATDTFTINADVDSNIIPDGDSTRNLGDSSNAWANIYVDTLNIKDGDIEIPDNGEIRIGSSDDLKIYHNGSHSYLDNNTGNLYIQNNVDDDDNGDIIIRAKAGEDSIKAYDDGTVELYYDGVKKLETKSDGVDITGELQCDTLDVDGAGDISGELVVGNVTADAGSQSAPSFSFTADDNTGMYRHAADKIGFTAAGESQVIVTDGTFEPDDDSEVDLGTSSKYFKTAYIDAINTTGNVDINGTLNVQGETTLQTHLNMGNSDYIKLGDGVDLQIVHDGTDSYISNTNANTGNLYLDNNADNNDVVIRSDDSSGGLDPYFRADGSSGEALLYYYGSAKLATKTGGIEVTGDVTYSDQLISTVSTGTPPLVITSTTEVSNLNVAYLQGYQIWSASNNWGVIPRINQGDGVMEIGKYIDFHNSDGDSSDGAVRLHTNGTTTDLYIAPGVTGSSEKIYTDADGSFTSSKQTAFAYIIFSAATNGTTSISNSQQHNIATVTERTTSGGNKSYRITYTNGASTQYYPNFVSVEPFGTTNDIISTVVGRQSEGFPADGSYADVFAFRGFHQGADDGDTHARWLGAQLGYAGSNVLRISFVAFDTAN